MFEFYIDGTLYKNPLNWNEFTESIEYNGDLKVFLFKYENKLNFTGGAYAYLYEKRNLGGICYVAEIEVRRSCSGGAAIPIFKGNIFVADCAFHINECLVKCSVVDNNYAGAIFNNSNIKVQMGLLETKNGLPITALIPVYLNEANYLDQAINMFDPADGTPIAPTDINIYFVHDAFTYLTYWLSDGTVGFKSDYLNYLTAIDTDAKKAKQLTFTKGKNIRLYNQNLQEGPSISFQQLFTELNKKYPVILTIEYDPTGKPFIRIEDEGYYRASGASITLNNLPDVVEKCDNSLMYGSIKVGGTAAEFTVGLHSYPNTEQITFKQENYYLRGTCNTSTEKDLFSEFISDTNIIQEILITNPANTEWDENIVWLEVDPSTGTLDELYDAIATVNFDTPVPTFRYHYNDSLFNKYVIDRASFHNDVYQALDPTATPVPVDVADFNSASYFSNVASFNWPIADLQYSLIRENPQKSILWNIGGSNREAWIKRTTHNFETSETDWELITNIANSQG